MLELEESTIFQHGAHEFNSSSSPASLITKSSNYDIDLTIQVSYIGNSNQQNWATKNILCNNKGKKMRKIQVARPPTVVARAVSLVQASTTTTISMIEVMDNNQSNKFHGNNRCNIHLLFSCIPHTFDPTQIVPLGLSIQVCWAQDYNLLLPIKTPLVQLTQKQIFILLILPNLIFHGKLTLFHGKFSYAIRLR